MATLARAASEPIERAGTKGLCIATRCADVDDFIAKFQAFCDETSMFLATGGTRAIGHASPFIILLADKTPVMRGTCTVLEAWTDGDNPFGRPGIRIALDELTESSREIFEQLLVARGDVEPPEPEPPVTPPTDVRRTSTMIGFPAIAGPQPVSDGPTERMSMPPTAVIDLGLKRPLPPLPPRSSPTEINVEGSGGVTRTKGMRVATPCTSVEKFIETFHPCCEPSSFFIATKSPRPIGLETAFSIDLADGRPMLRGYCTVLEAWPTGANRFRRPGVLLGLKQLTADSRQLFDRLLAAGKTATADTSDARPLVVNDRMTRPMVAIGRPGFAVPEIKSTKPRGDATLPLTSPSPLRFVAATPAAPPPAPPATPATSVDSEWSSPAEAEAPMLPAPPAPPTPPPLPSPPSPPSASTSGALSTRSVTDPAPVQPEMPAIEPKILVEPDIPVEHSVEPLAPMLGAMSLASVPSAPTVPLPIVAPVPAPVEALIPAPVVNAKPRPRRLAFAITFAAGIALGAVVGFTARPALAPTATTTVVTAPPPAAMPALPPAPAPVATVAAPPVPPKQAAVAPPTTVPAKTAPAVGGPALATAVKRPPAKHVLPPRPKHSTCTDLSCL